MTYPQPLTSTQITKGGASQWRFLTSVIGAGEIYEIDSPASAVALGPESDFGSIGLTYLDESNPPTGVSTIRVTPQFAAPLSLAPRFDTGYPVSPSRRGRILAWLIDNYNSGYLPIGFDVTSMALFRTPPQLDLIGWQTMPPTIPTRRGDKTLEFQIHFCNTANPNGGLWRLIPTFGRKYVFVDLFNNSGAAIQNYEVRGVNFSTVSNPNPIGPGPRDDSETVLVAPVAVGNGASNKKAIDASALGMFDSIAVFVSTVAGGTISNAPLRVYMSDDPI